MLDAERALWVAVLVQAIKDLVCIATDDNPYTWKVVGSDPSSKLGVNGF